MASATSAQGAVVMESSSSLPCTQTPGAGPGFLAREPGWWGFGFSGKRREEELQQLPPSLYTLMTPMLDPFWGPCLLSSTE